MWDIINWAFVCVCFFIHAMCIYVYGILCVWIFVCVGFVCVGYCIYGLSPLWAFVRVDVACRSLFMCGLFVLYVGFCMYAFA